MILPMEFRKLNEVTIIPNFKYSTIVNRTKYYYREEIGFTGILYKPLKTIHYIKMPISGRMEARNRVKITKYNVRK